MAKNKKASKKGTQTLRKGDERPSRGAGAKGSTDSNKERSKGNVKRKDSSKQTGPPTITTTERYRESQEGKRIKDDKIKGYKKVYEMNFKKDKDFDTLKDSIKNNDFSFLDKALTRNRPIKGAGPKMPQAVVIKFETSFRNEKHYSGKISEKSFVVRKENIKNLILERLNEYDQNFLEKADSLADLLEIDPDEVQEKKKKRKKLTQEEKEFNQCTSPYRPENISKISLSFIY